MRAMPKGWRNRCAASDLRKAVLLDGVPVLLDVTLTPERARVPDRGRWRTRSRHRWRWPTKRCAASWPCASIPAPFAAFVRDDPLFGPLVARTPGLRIVQSATVFEALTWAIIGQQINLPFAISLRRTFIEQAGRAHSSGLWCYPEAADVARLDLEALTSRKFSRAKAETLLRVARMVAEGELALDAGRRSGAMRRRCCWRSRGSGRGR